MNEHIASLSKFFQVYITKETTVIKSHMQLFVRGFYLIWLANAYFDWEVNWWQALIQEPTWLEAQAANMNRWGRYLGDNCIQNVHLGRYIVSYMVGNFVLRRRVSGAVKSIFRPYNRRYTAPNEHFEYGYPHSNAHFNIYSSKAQYFAPNWSFVSNIRQLRQPITSDVTYDVGAPMLYCRIY